MKKLIKTLIIILSILGVIMGAVAIVGPKVDSGGYRYIVGGFVKSYLTPKTRKVKSAISKLNNTVIKGVCHPKTATADELKEANVNWVRYDMAFPFESDGTTLSAGYLEDKNEYKTYQDNGVKCMTITPYPGDYYEIGIDPRTEEGLAKIAEDAKFLATDLQGCVSAIQVTNELTVKRFRQLDDGIYMSLEEAVKFIQVQLEAMNEVKGDILVGYNVADFSMYQLYDMVGEYNSYCDYLGVDLYLGCFESTFKDLFIYDLVLRGFYGQSKLPIILNEFGYIGAGVSYTEEERNAWLKENFGYNNELEAYNDIMNLINHENFNPILRSNLLSDIPEGTENREIKLADRLFNVNDTNNYRQHFYKEMNSEYQLTNYEHTEEGQANFYSDVINNHLSKMPFLLGCFAYMWAHSDACYICNQADCPVETGWSFFNADGSKKQSYYALKEAYGNWNFK